MTDDLRPFRERYSGPWTIELSGSDTYVVRAACGARLAWIYFRDLPREWRAGQFYALSRSEALAMASAIARLGTNKARGVAGLADQLDLFHAATGTSSRR